MKHIPRQWKPAARPLLSLLIAGLLAAGPGIAFADKPSAAEKGQGRKAQREQRDEQHSRPRQPVPEARQGGYFVESKVTVVRNYYGEQFRTGRCPPGLAKKNNGCLPPGQAKKWSVGKPLPRDVIFYEVPQALVVQIGIPPAGQRYVRVATDLLLIAIGTGMVLDAIEDLGRM